jgi:hypothetical protein
MLHKLLISTLIIAASALSSCGGDDARAWQAVQSSPSIATIDSFLAKYPNSGYRKAAMQQKQDFIWHDACLFNTEYAYRHYKYDYPEGKYADQVDTKITAITPDTEINLANLTSKTFVGTINYGDKQVSVLALQFSQIEEFGEQVRFQATINTNDMRKTLLGSINKTNYSINFEENPTDQVTLNLKPGRAYWRQDKIWLESTDPSQFWRLK